LAFFLAKRKALDGTEAEDDMIVALPEMFDENWMTLRSFLLCGLNY
jgi:hypothetical protein